MITYRGSADEMEKVKDGALSDFNIWRSRRGKIFKNEIQKDQLKVEQKHGECNSRSSSQKSILRINE